MSLTLSSSPLKMLNWFLTAPSVFQTSLDRFWTASVRKPICKLFKMAASEVGPATTTRVSRWSFSMIPGVRGTSA